MIKKSQLHAVLVQIQGSTKTTLPDGTEHVKDIGLLSEESGLGLKRKLRKIQKELAEYWNQFNIDAGEVDKIEDKEKKKVETERLLNETVELKSEKALMSEIEKINSSFPYDFELLELIAE